MPIAEDQLRETYREIEDSRPCHKCGYDLRGLNESASCPECGAPIRSRRSRSRFADNLTDAPLEYLRWLTLGFLLMSVSILVGSITVAYQLFARGGVPLIPPAVAHGLTLVAALAWLPGVWITTRRRPIGEHTTHDPILDHARLRSVIRWLQLAAPVSAAMAITSAYVPLPGSVPVFMIGAAVLGAVSLLAMVPLCVYLSSLTDWAGDSGIGERLRGAAWALAIFGPVTAGSIVLSSVAGVFKIAAGWGAIFIVIGAALFSWSILQLAGLSQWAVRNHISGAERDSRMAERERRERMEREERIDSMNDASDSMRAEAEALVPDEAPIELGEGGGGREIKHLSDPLPKVTSARPAPEPDRAPTSLPDMGEEHYQEHRIERPDRSGGA